MDMLSKGHDEFNSLDGGDRGELGVHIVEGHNEVFPMVPLTLPFFVICGHNASINVLPLSSEKTS